MYDLDYFKIKGVSKIIAKDVLINLLQNFITFLSKNF